MSYTRRYSETLQQTVSYTYPASERGGSSSVTVSIPVDVNINVDTMPFDRSVRECDNTITLLTGAVVATEAAEIATKKKNSKKIADSIIGGFFSYIKSEISAQISELSQNVDAQLMHLRELMQSCLDKKRQMESDYTRISGRYVKIFDDLNHELSNRIYELDKPAFAFKKETDNQNIRATDNFLVNTVSIFGAESGDMQSKISSSIAKKRALDTLNTAKLFLMQQKKLNNTIQQSMLNESKACTVYSPICYFETQDKDNQIDKTLYIHDYLSMPQSKKNELIEKYSANSIHWSSLSEKDKDNINLYFNSELNESISSNDNHSIRVREMIQRIGNISSINSINSKKI